MPQAGYVYILHGVGTNFIKVGKSTNLLRRLHDLQQGVPFPLQLISVQLVYDSDEGEKTLKARYADYQTRGEWFALPDHLLKQWPLEAPIQTLFAAREQDPPTRVSATKAAKVWLQDYLQSGEMPTSHILVAAKAVGLSERTLRRAREGMNIQVTQKDRVWYWQLTSISQVTELKEPQL
jgi:Meiotically up-regulated gene 113